MTMNFNLSGAQRKDLVTAIGQILEAKPQYLGAPSFAYQVAEYHIDKYGTVTGPDNNELANALRERGIITDTEAEAAEEFAYEARGENDEADNAAALTIEIPLAGFCPAKLDNLCKLVTAKETLLKAAFGAADLPIQVTDETIKFPWFGETTPEETQAYAAFVSLLCETAKTKKRVTAKDKPLDGSPKYAMRCFLLSLGFIGDEYKTARKILLSRLEGNSSWKNGKKAEEVSGDEVSE